MVKPTFELRVKKSFSVAGKPNSKAEAIIQRKQIKKEEQIEDAVQWCKINGKKDYFALKTGLFPLIIRNEAA